MIQERENTILQAAQRLVREKGSLTLRVVDVAKASAISVGTFYSHFDSKEDLILALTQYSAEHRKKRFEFVFSQPELGSDEALIAGVFANFLFALDHPGLYAAEELAVSRSISNFASEPRVASVQNAIEQIGECFRAQTSKSIDEGHFTPEENVEKQICRLDETAWMLMAGSTHVLQAQKIGCDGAQSERFLPTSLIQMTKAMFLDCGWTRAEPGTVVKECAERTLGLALPIAAI